MDIYYIDGEFVRADEAQISVNDLSVLRGFGVFDFLRSYNSVPFELKDHITRLAKSAQLIGLELPKTEQEIYDITMETIARNEHKEFNIRLVATGGLSSSNFAPEAGKAVLMIMVTELHAMPAWWYNDGIKVTTIHTERFMPGAKTTNYIPAIIAMKECKAQGGVEAIYVDSHGYLQEGTTSNFLAFINGKLVSPPKARILPGITRKSVFNVAEEEFEVEIRPIHIDEVPFMDEAIITASNKEIVPVTHINSVQISDGPGEQTQKLMKVWRAFADAYKG